ncbi:MAG: hypothetical protein E6H55_06455 [Betaproteobacteria bacterium]|nr:MAG: hypothetical protein E6H55_06455 [Betaproteobacteria bacterium]
MIGADVLRRARQHALEHGDDLLCALCGRPIGRPEFPRMQVHQALGVENRRIDVLRITPDEILHRILVGKLQRLDIGVRIRAVALGQRIDIRAPLR